MLAMNILPAVLVVIIFSKIENRTKTIHKITKPKFEWDLKDLASMIRARDFECDL